MVYPYLFNGTLACINIYITKLREALPLKVVKESNNTFNLTSTIRNLTQIEFDYNVKIWKYYTENLRLCSSIQDCTTNANYIIL